MQTAPNFSDTLAAEPTAALALPIGSRLRDYELTGIIGQGDWSAVYLAWDHVLQRQVAVKEYLPRSLLTRAAGATAVILPPAADLAAYRAGLKSFLAEARLLARFDHPSLLKVYRFWEENDTAYTVMPYYAGPTLAATLGELGRVPDESELRSWLRPLLNALAQLHQGGGLHLNISTETILLTPTGPVLLAPESARSVVAQRRGWPGILKPGFAAPEQYASLPGDAPAPASDLYALAAVVYTGVTGTPPQAADERRAHDHVQPLALLAAGLYDDRFLQAIDAALALDPARRPADDAAWRSRLGGLEADGGGVVLLPPSDPMQQPFVGADDAHREITVPDHPLLIGEPSAALPEVAVPARAKAPLRMPAPSGTATRPGAPDWADTQQVAEPPPPRRRSLYGLIAAACVIIGVAALAAQFAARQNERSAPAARVAAPADSALAVPASGASSGSAGAMAAASLAAPAATNETPPVALAASAAAPAVVASAVVAPAVVAPAVVAPSVVAPAAVAPAAVAPVVAAPVGQTRPGEAGPPASTAAAGRLLASPATPAATAAARPPTTSATTAASGAGPLPPALRAAPVVTLAPPGNEQERQARCTEILQKASLEQITAAETAYFKRECK